MKIILLALALGLTMPACAQHEKEMSKMDNSANKRLQAAAAAGDVNAIREAIRSGARIEFRDADGRTPLMTAVYKHHTDAARELIGAGASVNAQDKILNSPFLYAGAEGMTDIVRMCMKAGADYTVYNRYGGSALIPACERGHVETVKAILEDKKFPINHINRLGWTALLEAVILGNGGKAHIEIVQLLIDRGADLNIADKDGVTTLQHARQKRQTEIVRLLEQAGAK
ncbi:ankyrin repeat domain-containing protein [Chitinophaga deserti]|uniref:ankyrin repeat domain-containing protein n=1 Tax=Chitinophaga deserti TaxID=2164099 RepID=UPI000D6B483C|nr:ankyrin repeat domain-containing protein [Chitinophaga deserti]